MARSSRPFQLLFLFLVLTGCGGGSEEVAMEGVVVVEEVGLLGPRDIVHDPVADVYLVSNMNGSPFAEDENGFISQLSPEGVVQNLTWVTPSPGPGALHAPKAMTIRGDSLFVADLRCIGIFHRETGEPEGRQCMEGVSSLSGLDVGPEGSLFVTDSGLEEGAGGAQSTGTAAVYRLILGDDQRGSTLAQGAQLGHPLGLDIGPRGIFVATSDPGQILRLTAEGQSTTVLSSPTSRFESVVFLADGGFAYASASDSTLYRVDGQGQVHIVLSEIGSVGDLGYDATRNRLLVPLTAENRLLFIDLD